MILSQIRNEDLLVLVELYSEITGDQYTLLTKEDELVPVCCLEDFQLQHLAGKILRKLPELKSLLT